MNQIIRNTNPLFAPLLQELENQEFIKLFAEDPYTALEKVGIEMDLAEFTAYLSQDRDLYDSIIKKISTQVDVTSMDIPASSCCS
ncbi:MULTISPECIES: hypothetical protein [Bacillaceae]|uniref:hypothetical protein n=1 Tax=Bacillaceae TaxID=186817 RepID=UPI0003075CBD|nr:hypothetical protein [Bacillus sp. B1-b2]KAB7663888.1 hypothetical protein F9279_23460 [Bacillus sp. B1-b2]SLL37429.1 Uncharacterised protein [Mycobacteroides abscessus subsp. abscessus]HEO8422665.1 hypothetical protein [Yersinia enterocolitica]